MQEETEQKMLGELDFSEIDEHLQKLFPEQKIQFQDVLDAMMEGNPGFPGEDPFEFLFDDRRLVRFRGESHAL